MEVAAGAAVEAEVVVEATTTQTDTVVVVEEDTEVVTEVAAVPGGRQSCHHATDFCNLPGQYSLPLVSSCFISFRSSAVSSTTKSIIMSPLS